MFYTSLSMIFLVTGAVLCSPEHITDPDPSDHHQSPLVNDGPALELEKRSPHYDFGLGKRAYSYVSEYKRLPVYNFGLGKRSRPYSFGLGKRSVEDEPLSDEEYFLNGDQDMLANYLENYDDNNYEIMKRARPYSFGLGKRMSEDEIDEKRAKLYQFGLGKRLPMYNFGLGKRTKGYNFGLGKRLSKFNFGLGKRERDMSRFSFGLGKRSEDTVNEVDTSEI